MGATKDVLKIIKNEIAPKRGLINELMLETGPGGDGIIRAASKKAALQDRWFTASDSQAVFDVYKYFAIYQLRMANLLTEYWNTRSCTNTPVPPDCLSPTTIQQNLDKFQKDIDAQTALLKPPLPPGTFIDRNHDADVADGVMAAQRARRPQLDLGMAAAALHVPLGSGPARARPQSPYPLPRRTNLPLPALGPWTDWQTPTEDDFKSLIDGWEGDSPLAWLHKNTGFSTTTMSPQNDKDRLSGHMWFRDSFRPGFYLYVYRINLSEPDRPGPHVWYRSAYMP